MLTEFPIPHNGCDWPWPRVKRALEDRGFPLRYVADVLGVSPTAVSATARRRNVRVQAAIAAILHTQPSVIWPTRYTADGLPIRKPRGRRVRAEAA